MSHWIYLSPHLDDAALSCGGLIWEQTRQGDTVEVWTIFSGDPPTGKPFSAFAEEHHQRWQTGPQAAAARRAEDVNACQAMGATYRHFEWPDVIYRSLPGGEWLVETTDDLWKTIHPGELPLLQTLQTRLEAAVPAGARLVAPMTLGGHVDHRLTRAAAEWWEGELYYYADYPYAATNPEDLPKLLRPEWRVWRQAVSLPGLAAWQAAVEAYTSQVSTFWADLDEMRAALAAYLAGGGGDRLWVAERGGLFFE